MGQYDNNYELSQGHFSFGGGDKKRGSLWQKIIMPQLAPGLNEAENMLVVIKGYGLLLLMNNS